MFGKHLKEIVMDFDDRIKIIEFLKQVSELNLKVQVYLGKD